MGVLLLLLLIQATAHSPFPAAVALNRAGVLKMNQHLFREAAAVFREALAADPDFDLARTNLGIALLYGLSPADAESVLRGELTRNERNAAAQYCLGLVLKGKGASAEALECFRRVIELDPECSAGYYHIGVLNVRERRLEPAELALRRCLELEPSHAGALYNLGMLLIQSGRADEGNAVMERFRAVRGNARPPASGMGGGGMEYGELGKYAVARDYVP